VNPASLAGILILIQEEEEEELSANIIYMYIVENVDIFRLDIYMHIMQDHVHTTSPP